MQHREETIEHLECVYEAIFTLALMPFLYLALNQILENALYAYLLTAILSIWMFGLSLFANQHLFRPLRKKFITYLDKFFQQ